MQNQLGLIKRKAILRKLKRQATDRSVIERISLQVHKDVQKLHQNVIFKPEPQNELKLVKSKVLFVDLPGTPDAEGTYEGILVPKVFQGFTDQQDQSVQFSDQTYQTTLQKVNNVHLFTDQKLLFTDQKSLDTDQKYDNVQTLQKNLQQLSYNQTHSHVKFNQTSDSTQIDTTNKGQLGLNKRGKKMFAKQVTFSQWIKQSGGPSAFQFKETSFQLQNQIEQIDDPSLEILYDSECDCENEYCVLTIPERKKIKILIEEVLQQSNILLHTKDNVMIFYYKATRCDNEIRKYADGIFDLHQKLEGLKPQMEIELQQKQKDLQKAKKQAAFVSMKAKRAKGQKSKHVKDFLVFDLKISNLERTFNDLQQQLNQFQIRPVLNETKEVFQQRFLNEMDNLKLTTDYNGKMKNIPMYTYLQSKFREITNFLDLQSQKLEKKLYPNLLKLAKTFIQSLKTTTKKKLRDIFAQVISNMVVQEFLFSGLHLIKPKDTYELYSYKGIQISTVLFGEIEVNTRFQISHDQTRKHVNLDALNQALHRYKDYAEETIFTFFNYWINCEFYSVNVQTDVDFQRMFFNKRTEITQLLNQKSEENNEKIWAWLCHQSEKDAYFEQKMAEKFDIPQDSGAYTKLELSATQSSKYFRLAIEKVQKMLFYFACDRFNQENAEEKPKQLLKLSKEMIEHYNKLSIECSFDLININ